jgi:hypothetical protein
LNKVEQVGQFPWNSIPFWILFEQVEQVGIFLRKKGGGASYL